MDRIHIAHCPKISSRFFPRNRQGPHKKIETGNLEYKRKNQNGIVINQNRLWTTPTNCNGKIKPPLCISCGAKSEIWYNLRWLYRKILDKVSRRQYSNFCAVRLGQLSTRQYKNSNERKKLTFCPWPRQDTKNTRWLNGDICQHRCQLLPTKKGPQLYPHCIRWKSNKLPRKTHDKEGLTHQVKDTLEQYPQNWQC